MKCPKCGRDNDTVIDSRTTIDETQIRRRRKCLECTHRYTTYELSADDLQTKTKMGDKLIGELKKFINKY